jgi:hypothetical protein
VPELMTVPFPPVPPPDVSIPEASIGSVVVPPLLQVWSSPIMTHCATAIDGHEVASQNPVAKHVPARSNMI